MGGKAWWVREIVFRLFWGCLVREKDGGGKGGGDFHLQSPEEVALQMDNENGLIDKINGSNID